MKIVFILICCFQFVPTLSLCTNDPSERNALLSIYTSTNGSNWIYPQNSRFTGKPWNTSDNYCDWYGVSCDRSCQVIDLYLNDCNLNGKLDPEISNLTSLRGFYLFNNPFLFGRLPSSWSQLQYLSISNTSIDGTIDFGPHSSLISMIISRTYINEIGPNWPKLQILFADASLITSFSGNYPQLLSLSLASTLLDRFDLALLCQYEKLAYLDVSNSNLTGSIPNCLTNLSLFELYLQNNALTALPIPFFPYIQILNVANNQIDGDLGQVISSTLRSGYFSNNHLYTSWYYVDFPQAINLAIDGNNITAVRFGSALSWIDLRRNPSNLFQFDPKLKFHLDYSVEIRTEKRTCPTLVSKDTTRPIRVLVSEDYFEPNVCY